MTHWRHLSCGNIKTPSYHGATPSRTTSTKGATTMQEKMCESCGMPMGETDEMYGTEANGNKNTDYCKH